MNTSPAQDWTDQKDPRTNARTLGTMVECALIDAGGFLAALTFISEQLDKGTPEAIKLARTAANNALVGAGVLGSGTSDSVYTNFKNAWYGAIPREGGEPTSYG